jgi:hypothetical protein
MAGGPRAHRVASFGQLRCTHEQHARVAHGRGEDGHFLSADTAAYPVEMCAWVIDTLFADEDAGVSAVGYAELPSSAAQRAAAQGLDAANRAAAAAALADDSMLSRAAAGLVGVVGDAAGDSGPVRADARLAWQAAPEKMPLCWAERADAVERLEAARSTELAFISRRRAEAADGEDLVLRPIPQPHARVERPARGRRPSVPWPAGAPPRPIHIRQLYFHGIYAEIREELMAHSAGIAAALQRQGTVVPKRAARIWRAESCQPAWARGVVWDCTDPEDCVPLQPNTAEDPPADAINREFFQRWATRLRWGDADMLEQVTESGVESRSGLELATVIMGHHGGLRNNIQPARESIEHDTNAGWMTAARLDLWTVPARLVPKNVVSQLKWRMGDDGAVYRKRKHRVTTDDSVEPHADGEHVDARNGAIDRDGWGGAALPGVRTLAEALAIVKATSQQMGVQASAAALERVALWAVDLSNAYRELAAARSERWQQCFVWAGGAKLDLRCVFGAAHMVDFFQRVSTFILAVAVHRIHEYDRRHPPAPARAEWLRWRQQRLGGEQHANFASIYLDDGSGFVPLGEGEPLAGAPAGQESDVKAHVAVEPDGRVRFRPFVNRSRAQMHLAIVRATFSEAGWGIAEEKVQLGLSIDLLGLAVTSEGDGCLFVPEAKRRGMIVDIQEQRAAPGGLVPRESVEALTGRCSHLAQVACEGNAYLQPFYRVQNAQWVIGGMRRKPRSLRVTGTSSTLQQYAAALDWWEAVLERGVSVPLAPRVCFPRLGDEGCAYLFTDAAREGGTGYGGHSTVVVGDRPFFIFREQRWSAHALKALQDDAFSMPAGECFGAVTFADALLRALGGVTHLVVYTDSDATAKAFTAASSGAPQLNAPVQWLLERHPGVQFLGVHQPGTRNEAADALSRTAAGRQRVLQQAAAAGAELIELQFGAADAAAEAALLAVAMACPLRR